MRLGFYLLCLLLLAEPSRAAEVTNREGLGRIIECVGECLIYRGEGFAHGRFRSQLKEGDDLVTASDGMAWVLLVDGSLLRLGPKSSISLREMNIALDQVFFHSRLNYGQVFWLARSSDKVKVETRYPTDTIVLPLSLYEANPALDNKKRLALEPLYMGINKALENNGQWNKNLQSRFHLVTTNGEIEASNASFVAMSTFAQSLYVRRINGEEFGIELSESNESSGSVQLRARANQEVQGMNLGAWYEVDAEGDEAKEIAENKQLSYVLFPIKRIPSLLMARELMFDQYYEDFWQALKQNDAQTDTSFKLYELQRWSTEAKATWDLNARIAYIKKLSQEQENFHLKVLAQFLNRLKLRQEALEAWELEDYYGLSLSHYVKTWSKNQWAQFEKGDILMMLKRRNQSYERSSISHDLGESEP